MAIHKNGHGELTATACLVHTYSTGVFHAFYLLSVVCVWILNAMSQW